MLIINPVFENEPFVEKFFKAEINFKTFKPKDEFLLSNDEKVKDRRFLYNQTFIWDFEAILKYAKGFLWSAQPEFVLSDKEKLGELPNNFE